MLRKLLLKTRMSRVWKKENNSRKEEFNNIMKSKDLQEYYNNLKKFKSIIQSITMKEKDNHNLFNMLNELNPLIEKFVAIFAYTHHAI